MFILDSEIQKFNFIPICKLVCQNLKKVCYYNLYGIFCFLGLNKAETAAKHGDEQVKIWRRSFDTPPPPMEKDHPYYENIVKDERYTSL